MEDFEPCSAVKNKKLNSMKLLMEYAVPAKLLRNEFCKRWKILGCRLVCPWFIPILNTDFISASIY